MTKLATMGTSSCATIAIQGFKSGQKEINEAYRADPKSFTPSGMGVNEFYNSILYPTRQDLGRTDDMPFEKLMEDLEKSSMKTKFTIATLNASQHNEGYWRERLEAWGFQVVDQTDNTIGQRCYIYTRNNNRPANVEVKSIDC